MLASGFGHETVVTALLAAGADVHATNAKGTSAMTLAADKGHEAIVTRLRIGDRAIADGDLRQDDRGRPIEPVRGSSGDPNITVKGGGQNVL